MPINYYDEKISKFYDTVVGSGYLDYNSIVSALQKILGNRQNILEIGCGTGNVCILLAKLGYNLTCIDNSEYMIEITKQKARKENTEIEIYQQDITCLKLNQKFDAIFSVGGPLCWVGKYMESYPTKKSDLQKSLKGFYNLLNKNGLFVINQLPERKSKLELKIKPNLTYKQECRFGKSKINIRHILSNGKKILVDKKFNKLIFSENEFNKTVQKIGFKIDREDKTKNFRVYRKM